MKNDLGDRMKEYEKRETHKKFLPMIPICARIDGRNFSNFTKGFNKPFDPLLSLAMWKTGVTLLHQTHACMAFVQSDEISLFYLKDTYYSGVFFEGKVQKMCSVLAGIATAAFMLEMPIEHANKLPHFDCRVWQVPTREEAANVLLWRTMDAKRNAVTSVCRSLYSHKEMQHKNQDELLKMIVAAGVSMDDYSIEVREGMFIQERKVAHILDGITCLRNRTSVILMPFFMNVTNRAAVIFDAAEPET